MAAAHAHPEIQARTFATLILGAVIRRDAVTGELTDERVRQMAAHVRSGDRIAGIVRLPSYWLG